MHNGNAQKQAKRKILLAPSMIGPDLKQKTVQSNLQKSSLINQWKTSLNKLTNKLLIFYLIHNFRVWCILHRINLFITKHYQKIWFSMKKIMLTFFFSHFTKVIYSWKCWHVSYNGNVLNHKFDQCQFI